MVIYRDEYRLYNFGPNHPFSPVRLEMLTSLLEALGVWRKPLSPPEASREEVLTVHSERLVRRVEAASRGEGGPDLEHYGLGTGDTPVFPGMDRAARLLVGGPWRGRGGSSPGRGGCCSSGGGSITPSTIGPRGFASTTTSPWPSATSPGLGFAWPTWT